jgi:ribosomal protein S1
MKIGEVVEAKFIRAEPYGVFLEYDNETVFVQVIDLDWIGGFYDPFEFSKISNTHDVLIRGYVEERNQFYGSIKDAHPELDPWIEAKKYRVGAELSGVVTSNTEYGTIIQIFPGLVGLLHSDEGGGGLEIGGRINVTIKNIDHDRRRMEFENKGT